MSQTVIDATDLRIWYGTPRGPVRAVDGVSFSVGRGEILGLVGESGCGKSTLGRGLLDLLPEGATMDGALNFKGENLLAMTRRQRFQRRGRDLAMIFQEPLTRLNPLMRISEHFIETLRTHHPKMSPSEIENRSLEVLRVIGIPPSRWKAYPHEFSGGMRQRLMIALALVLRPAFVVADEPTTALDVLVEAQIIKILHDLRANFDTSLLLITHKPGDHRGGLRPGGGDVRREDRRDRRRPDGVRRSAASLHAGVIAFDDHAGHRRAAFDSGGAAGSGVAAVGLPLPSPMPGRDGGLPDAGTGDPSPRGWAGAGGQQRRGVLGGEPGRPER